jgi:hypothetical protein
MSCSSFASPPRNREAQLGLPAGFGPKVVPQLHGTVTNDDVTPEGTNSFQHQCMSYPICY